jgi:hypothetical protein
MTADRSRPAAALTRLWTLRKGTNQRSASIRRLELGFEIKVVDESGAVAFVQECPDEAECRRIADEHYSCNDHRRWLEA